MVLDSIVWLSDPGVRKMPKPVIDVDGASPGDRNIRPQAYRVGEEKALGLVCCIQRHVVGTHGAQYI